VFGVALHHAGLHAHDRKTVEQLFYAGKLQVLVCTSTLACKLQLQLPQLRTQHFF
jgi:replicative superfamily II helicase